MNKFTSTIGMEIARREWASLLLFDLYSLVILSHPRAGGSTLYNPFSKRASSFLRQKARYEVFSYRFYLAFSLLSYNPLKSPSPHRPTQNNCRRLRRPLHARPPQLQSPPLLHLDARRRPHLWDPRGSPILPCPHDPRNQRPERVQLPRRTAFGLPEVGRGDDYYARHGGGQLPEDVVGVRRGDAEAVDVNM